MVSGPLRGRAPLRLDEADKFIDQMRAIGVPGRRRVDLLPPGPADSNTPTTRFVRWLVYHPPQLIGHQNQEG